jgi:hydrogenase nickel incorporation protein HypA/HybF
MHELSIAMSILDVAEEEAQRQGDCRVTAVHMRLGPLSGVVKEALLNAFELAREGTGLSDCELRIEEVPIVAYCPRCDAQRKVVSMQNMRCSQCDEPAGEVVSGREMEVCAMEIVQDKEAETKV